MGTKLQSEPKMNCVWGCQRALLKVFYKYGHFVARHPIIFIILPVVICGGLAVGFMLYDPLTDMEALYAPEGSRASDDRETVEATFPDSSGGNYDQMSIGRLPPQGVIIFRSIQQHSVLTPPVLSEIQSFHAKVLALTVTADDGSNFTFEDVCGRQKTGPNMTSCYVDAAHIFQDPKFINDLAAKQVTYPFYIGSTGPMDLSQHISDVVTINTNTLVSAGTLRLSFTLRQDTAEGKKMSLKWEKEYLKFVEKQNFTTVKFAYSVSESLSEELDKGTTGDILFFSLTFTIMCTYASVVSTGGDCVSTRALLANAGILAAGLGIMGAFGLISLTGVRFVNIVGVMPFLTLGIGVDDMFLLMSSWSETLSLPSLTVEERVGIVFKKAGIGITITSLTDMLAFSIGATSVFRSVRNFCLYTGMGVFLCYLCNITFFAGCLTLHGRRVYARRHTLTCQVVGGSREQLLEKGRSCCAALVCSGNIPKEAEADQSLCEKGPKLLLTRFVLWTPVRITVVFLFACYLAVAIWGCTNLKQGLELKNLVLTSSYYHKFEEWQNEDFGSQLPVSFVTTNTKEYSDPQVLTDIKSFLDTTKTDPYIWPDYDMCWLTMMDANGLYTPGNETKLIENLDGLFSIAERFRNDIVLSPDGKSIIASRFYAFTIKLNDSNEEADIMERMRDLADSSSLDIFAYHPAFIFYEQFVTILPSTLKTVGITLAVMFVITCIFLPHPLIVMIVMVQVVMIVVGVFGFMTFWGLTLSSVTMIHLIMSVGFSVDFCAHVCTAYMVSDETTRFDRAKDTIVHASGPIFNGGISSLIGVVVLLFSESYIFQSFFKIMLLVIGFGVLHAVFLVPVILSVIGPAAHVNLEDSSPSSENDINGSAKSKKMGNVTCLPDNSVHAEKPHKRDDHLMYNNDAFDGGAQAPHPLRV